MSKEITIYAFLKADNVIFSLTFLVLLCPIKISPSCLNFSNSKNKLIQKNKYIVLRHYMGLNSVV